jgi:EAL domain-containing protein (putative c-di-GMP-specific phosphodiesterase class I)
LRKTGIKITIDDFGTGFSSLSYLQRFHVDKLKIDRSFTREIPEHTDNAAITTAIIAMAHSLNLEVTAEGVETDEQLAFLRTLDCDRAQGYLVSRPLPAEDLARLLAKKDHRTYSYAN